MCIRIGVCMRVQVEDAMGEPQRTMWPYRPPLDARIALFFYCIFHCYLEEDKRQRFFTALPIRHKFIKHSVSDSAKFAMVSVDGTQGANLSVVEWVWLNAETVGAAHEAWTVVIHLHKGNERVKDSKNSCCCSHRQ